MKLNYYRQIEESAEVSVEDFIEYCRKDLEKENLIGGDLLDYIGDNFNELLKEFINSDMENVEPLDDSFDDLYKAIEERLCND
jgi:TPP-dependent pyruvate/acetoin dehydrogenase alpha subunit